MIEQFKVREAIGIGLIELELAEIIPIKCENCGEELSVTVNITQIFCSNRFCFSKIASRLESMAKQMKVDGWGFSTCINVVKHFKLKSPFQVLLLQGRESPEGVSVFQKKVEDICNASKKERDLWEVVQLANIPSIDTIAFKIFSGYSSIALAYEDIEKLGVPFIAEKLGIKNQNSGVMSVTIYNTLIEYKDELEFGEKQFNVMSVTGEMIRVAITGAIQGYINKSEFINFVNNKYKGIVNLIQVNNVTNDTDVLISDGDTYSNKYKRALEMSNNGHKILMKSSKDFLLYLDRHYGNSN